MFVFFNDTATTEIYTLSLHDALPIYQPPLERLVRLSIAKRLPPHNGGRRGGKGAMPDDESQVEEDVGEGEGRSEEHTSELQSRQYLVCRLLLEKKKKMITASIRETYY